MITLSGKSVFGGVAIGKIVFYKRQEKQVRRYHVEDTEAEVARFEDAQETAIAQLGELYDKAMEDVGEANAAIFEVHQMMLMDLDYVDSIKNIITTRKSTQSMLLRRQEITSPGCLHLWMMLTCRDVRPM